MYKQRTTSAATSTESSERDSKYTVAQILSSMTTTAREAPITPVSFSAGVTYPTAASTSGNLLTPTTFATLERTLDLAIQSDNSAQQQQVAPESGFVPPVVDPIVIDPSTGAHMPVKREYDANWDDGSSCSSTDPDWNPSTSKRRRTDKSIVPHIDPNTYLMPNSRRPTGPRKERTNEVLPPEEAEKRALRRERNKVAAAKCRQRRVDQTNTLINETENLEEDNAELENEIQSLRKQAEELTFLLEAHRPTCKHSQLQHPVQHSAPSVKAENYMSLPCTSAAPISSYPMSRPSTLPLRTTQAPAHTAPVSITTPSSGINFTLGLDSLIDGHTGLTPLTAGPPPPSCSSQVQQHRNSSDSGSSPNKSPNTSSAQLISL